MADRRFLADTMPQWIKIDDHCITNGRHPLCNTTVANRPAYWVWRRPPVDANGKVIFGTLSVFLASFVHDGTPDDKFRAYQAALKCAHADLHRAA